MSRKKNVAKKEVKTATPVKTTPVAPAKAEAAKTEVKAETKEVAVEEKKVEPAKTATSAKTEEKVVVKEEVKAVETKKEESKKRGRKPAAEKAATTAKKTAKAEVKETVEEVFFELNGEQFLSNTIVERIKEEWKNEGHRISSIKTLRVYVNLEERNAYYVINDKAENKFVTF